MKRFYAAVLILAAAAWIAGGQAAGERVTATFSDASRPGLLSASVMNGSISVKGGATKEVVIETAARDQSRGRSGGASGGLTRIPITASGLTVEEESNRMSVRVDAHSRTIDLRLQVPQRTSLKLKSNNDGHIEVSGVEGELDIHVLNGPLTLQQVGGTVVAHSLNGKVLVTMTRADPKPMAFSSLNGDVDVTLPAGIKANVVMTTDNGDIYSDFEIKTSPVATPQTEDRRAQGGKFRIKIDKAVRGAINGGGPEILFKTFNGNIYIRKAGG